MNEYIQDYFANVTRRHPQTNEPMLSYAETTQLLAHITQTKCAIILGGDVLDKQYQYLVPNWHYTPDDSFSRDENIQRSCEYARSFIQGLPHKHKAFFILVLCTDTL